MKICPVCQKEFKPKSKTQRCCSKECRYSIRKIQWRYCNRKDCLYYNDSVHTYNRCDYNYLTDNLRCCKKGAECTKYKHATPTERRRYRDKILRKDNEGGNKPIF